jgi:hypothetical protein
MKITKQYIFIFLLIILVFIIIKKYKKSNNYFLSLHDSINIMTNEEYFTHFNNYDYKLRKCFDINNCKTKYRENVLEFSNNEKNVLTDMLNQFLNKLTKYQKIFKNLKLIKVGNYIESTLPHTRKTAIVLSQKWITQFVNNNINNRFITLISHEQFHIFQRYNPQLMEDLYTNYWNMIKYNKLPQKLLEINRTNPDALPNNIWLFPIGKGDTKAYGKDSAKAYGKDSAKAYGKDSAKAYILPLCIYDTKNNSSIRDTKNVYFNLEKKGNKIEFSNLDKEIKNQNLLSQSEEFRDFFGSETSNNYHPNELSASLFEIIIENHLNNMDLPNIPALNKFEGFLKNL